MLSARIGTNLSKYFEPAGGTRAIYGFIKTTGGIIVTHYLSIQLVNSMRIFPEPYNLGNIFLMSLILSGCLLAESGLDDINESYEKCVPHNIGSSRNLHSKTKRNIPKEEVLELPVVSLSPLFLE